jgi:hypothetical protein
VEQGEHVGQVEAELAHPTTLAPVRWRGGGGDHGVMAVAYLRWSATAVNDSCSLMGPSSGERRSTMRTTTAGGGVSSPKRGINDGDGLNSNGNSGAPVARRGHEDKAGERGCAHAAGEGGNGRGRKGTTVTRQPTYTNAMVWRGGSGGRLGTVLYGEEVEEGPDPTDRRRAAGNGPVAALMDGMCASGIE